MTEVLEAVPWWLWLVGWLVFACVAIRNFPEEWVTDSKDGMSVDFGRVVFLLLSPLTVPLGLALLLMTPRKK